MKVQDIVPAITKRIWIVIALVLFSTLVAAVIAQVQTPVYKVETTLSATAPANPTTKLPDATVQGSYVIGGMVSIANYAESIGVAEAVSARLANQGIEISPEELLKKVSAVPEANSASMKLTFSDGSPTGVADIANAWGDVLVLKSNQTTEFYDEEFKKLLLNGNIVFTNRAVIPEKPTQPKTFAYIGLGFFTGLILGLVLVLFIEYFNPRFRNPREVEETLDLPILGTLPREKGARSTALLSSFSEGSRTWEAYSELRSSLIMPAEGSPPSILVASAIPFEPGAAVAANIAASIANTGRKVLLMDCDLRGRTLSKFMEAIDKPGLSDVLEKRAPLESSIVASKLANLSFLPAGTRKDNSTDLLSLPAFSDGLREQELRYDKVLLYGPPLTASVDAAVIAAQAEASLVIIDADHCTRKAAQEAMFNFERLGIVPTGVTLANVKVKGRDSARRAREGKPARDEARVKEVPAPVPPTAPLTEAAPAAPQQKKGRRAKEPRDEKPVLPPGPAAVASSAAVVSAAVQEIREEPETEPPADTAAPAAAAPALSDAALAEAVEEEVLEEIVEDIEEAAEAAPPAAPAAAPMPSWGHAPATPARDGLQKIKESVAEDFRRMGETGAPIPKNWLRALNSDKTDVRESATAAITVYYQSFLRRYSISDESVERITASIISMMRREGEYAGISEEEAQRRLKQMLVDSGARFSTPVPASGAPTTEQATGAQTGVAEEGEKDVKRQEKRRFRLDSRGSRKTAGKGRDGAPQPGEEEGVDWE
jgi:capsular exopolysaccharide synthesis family protein